MTNRSVGSGLARPVLIPCQWGGWLAVSEEGSALRIGVTAATEVLAREAFESELREWVRLLAAEEADD